MRTMTETNPCLSCGTTIGTGWRGLCQRCYQRAWAQGTQLRYPACGAVPVPYRGRKTCGSQPVPHPLPLPERIDLATLLPGGKHVKHWDGAWASKAWRDRVAWEQARGAEWMRARSVAA